MPEKTNFLLPNFVVPINYEIQINPDLNNFSFEGSVSIHINIHEPVRKITLHAGGLKIGASGVVVLYGHQLASVVCQEVSLNEELQTATFVFDAELPVGSAVLKIKYSGLLNDKMAGFYRSKYITVDGQTKYLAITQFEATDARRAFPCWDEPARKATFDLCLVVPKNLTALSNMPIKSVEQLQDTDLQIVNFDRTPIMSTYLLAFGVGEFEFIETTTDNGTIIRVYTMLGRSEQGKFASEVGKRSLEFYNKYFDFAYPLPKLDMIAIPDFASGAMENWGLVTYRENALLIDDNNSSASSKQRIAEVVAHELAHQWFGNLVTMEWWTNLWLNEGFASWMANFALDNLFPEWSIWDQFLSDDYASALSLDGLRSTHPIEIPVGNPNEISQIFDAISYSKGASVIRMIHDFLGAEIFCKGLQLYLKRHAYSNAITEDLWRALEEISGQPVQKMMDTWTKQAGYPLIEVKQNDESTCVLSQKRFLASGRDLTPEETNQSWYIPVASEINNQFGESERIKDIFFETSKKISTQGVNYIKLNSGQIALVRVNYLPQQWLALAKTISDGKLDPADRYGIISDALSLARAGYMSTNQLIELLSAYKNEDNYIVWMAVLAAVKALENLLEETEENNLFTSFAVSAFKSIADKLGWNPDSGETHTTKLLRESMLAAAGNYGDQDIIAQAKLRFNDHASKISSVDPDLRRAVYSIAAKYGDSATFNSLLELYRQETFQEEKVRLLAALGKFGDSEFLPAVMDFAFSSGEVRHGDLIYVLASMGGYAKGRRVAWKFLTENWNIIEERYSGGGLKMLGRIISLVCDGFTNKKDAELIEQFFKNNPAPSATRAIAESIERITVRAVWYERDKNEIASALKKLF